MLNCDLRLAFCFAECIRAFGGDVKLKLVLKAYSPWGERVRCRDFLCNINLNFMFRDDFNGFDI